MAGYRADRFQRPPAPPPFQMTPRDEAILLDLARARCLGAEEVSWLHFDGRLSSRCHRRLFLLWAAGYLHRRAAPGRPGYAAPLLYTLTRRGREWLLARGLAAAETLPPTTTPPNPLFLSHLHRVGRLYAALAAALNRHPAIALADFWGEHRFRGQGRYDRLPVGGGQWQPVMPDALLIARRRQDGARRFLFFEIDRGTMSLARLEKKVIAYEAWRRPRGARRFQARFGVPPRFDVVFVLPSATRLGNVYRTVSNTLRRLATPERERQYHFLTEAHLSPDHILQRLPLT